MRKPRNYKAEYRSRIASGKARGLTRSQSRGHAKANEAPLRAPKSGRSPELEVAVREMNRGSSLTGAARALGVSRERLARYLREQGVAVSNGRRWKMQDERPRWARLVSRGEVHDIIVNGFQRVSDAGAYWAAMGRFLETNQRELLAPFRDRGVSNYKGRYFPFETDPNELYRLSFAGLGHFYEVYERTAP